MIELLIVSVIGLLVVAAANVVSPRLGIASPLVLVLIGVAASFLPMFENMHLDPEWILAGLLPPLLYSAAVSMPPMNFRREFGPISGLSVFLVIASSLLLGAFFSAVIPDLSFAWGVALGAIVSPTDAVATSIIKRMPVSRRVVSILDGESLLNDATALVLLRTAIVATAASFSIWGAIATFVYSVVAALVLGIAIGWLNLAVRKRVTDSTVNTVISFTVPFLASVPAELIGASGLFAAVVAGLVTGIRAPRDLSPQNRLSDSQNWRTVELVLEGAVFLMMGLQLATIVTDVERDHAGVGVAVLIAGGALVLTVLVRAAYVAPLLGVLARRAGRHETKQARLQGLHDKISAAENKQVILEEYYARSGIRATERDLERFSIRVRRALADIDYFLREPLRWREGAIVVWAGMRGAVTVAAAQTLPLDAPHRSMLILVAFAVAVMSMLIQGGTIGPLLGKLNSANDEAALGAQAAQEHEALYEMLRSAASTIAESRTDDQSDGAETFRNQFRHRVLVIEAQRAALLDARDDGTFGAEVLAQELANLDAAQIALEMRA